MAIWGDTHRAWAILIVDFLFFVPLSAGLVVWPAIVLARRGQVDGLDSADRSGGDRVVAFLPVAPDRTVPRDACLGAAGLAVICRILGGSTCRSFW